MLCSFSLEDFSSMPYIQVNVKPSDSQCVANIDPGAILWTIIVEVHYRMLHTEYLNTRPYGFWKQMTDNENGRKSSKPHGGLRWANKTKDVLLYFFIFTFCFLTLILLQKLMKNKQNIVSLLKKRFMLKEGILIEVYKAISDSKENCKLMNCIVSNILNYIMCTHFALVNLEWVLCMQEVSYKIHIICTKNIWNKILYNLLFW